jgi:hypothetical protein
MIQQVQSRTQLAVFAGATRSQNALMFQQKTGTSNPEKNNWYFLEDQYEVVGIAFRLDSESARYPSSEFRLESCDLPGLMDLCQLDVLSETQLKTVLGKTLASEEQGKDERTIENSWSIRFWPEYWNYKEDTI